MKLVNARVAGVLYLVILVFGLFTEVLVRGRLIVRADAVATAENILDAEWLFRFGFAASLVYTLGEVAMTIILYLLFRPVSRELSMIAAAFRLTSLAIFGINLLNMFAALLILAEADYMTAFGTGQPEALALLFLDLHRYGYLIGLTFFAVNCFFMGYLLVRSSHVPTVLGILLGVAGLGYLTNSFMFFLIPGYDGSVLPLLLAPAVVAETWFCLVLLWKGGGVPEWAEPGGR